MAQQYLIIQCAALGHEFLKENHGLEMAGLDFKKARSVFPALTCPVQASFRAATPASGHGMVFNGHYARPLLRPSFWEQSSNLVSGPRIWDRYRSRGGKVGLFFWQQSLGEQVDMLLSPWPVHKHGHGMIDVTYSRPSGLYDKLVKRLGARFRLLSYWGPLAGIASSRWIARATQEVMGMEEAPGVLFTYLPHLDYALQKYPAHHKKCRKSLKELAHLLTGLVSTAKNFGYEVLVFGDYAIGPATNTVYPNKVLQKAGFLKVRYVRGKWYPDYYASQAFAVADHEIAHVYLKDPAQAREIGKALQMPEKMDVVYGDGLRECGMDHPQSGEILLVGKPGTWFAYPWWEDKKQAPDFAGHIDIHNKPGYDPCELFMGANPFRVSTDVSRVQGTHGTVGDDRLIAWASTFDLGEDPQDILGISRALKNRLDTLLP